MDSEIYTQATIGECDQFMLEGKKQSISVIISPLKMIQEKSTMKITQGCNMWRACENINCQYSQVHRDKHDQR